MGRDTKKKKILGTEYFVLRTVNLKPIFYRNLTDQI